MLLHEKMQLKLLCVSLTTAMSNMQEIQQRKSLTIVR